MVIPKLKIIGKYSEKRKNTIPLTIKITLKPKCWLSGSPVFTFSLPGVAIRPYTTSITPLCIGYL